MQSPNAVAAMALSLFTTFAAGTAIAHESSQNGVTAAHPWARATPGGTSASAAYLEIRTAAGMEDRLVGASSPAARRTEIHTHVHEGNVMRMRRVEALSIPAGESRVLKPSGDHIMLMDLVAPLKEGETVKITLQFERAGPIEVEATVEPVGAMGPHGMAEQPPSDPKAAHSHH